MSGRLARRLIHSSEVTSGGGQGAPADDVSPLQRALDQVTPASTAMGGATPHAVDLAYGGAHPADRIVRPGHFDQLQRPRLRWGVTETGSQEWRRGAVVPLPSKARVDGFALECQHTKGAFVDSPEWLVSDKALQPFDAQCKLARGQRALGPRAACSEPLEPFDLPRLASTHPPTTRLLLTRRGGPFGVLPVARTR